MAFNLKSLLKDKTVLYVVLFFAVTNFFGYILLKNYDAVIFMVLIGLITSYFSKNMIVILLASIVVTTLLTGMTTVKEGFDAKKDTDSDNKKDPEEKTHLDSSSNSVSPSSSKDPNKKVPKKKEKKEKKESFSNELSPQSLETGDNSDNEGYHSASENTDKELADPHSTEGAIDNLDTLLTSGVDSDTLIQNHQAVVKNMKNLEPLIASTKSLVDGLNNSGLIQNLSNVHATLAKR